MASIISWDEGWKEIKTNALDVIERHLEAEDNDVRKLFSNAELARLQAGEETYHHDHCCLRMDRV
eukprot:scaffold90_cov163-Ochromonas_danica.AAC.21